MLGHHRSRTAHRGGRGQNGRVSPHTAPIPLVPEPGAPGTADGLPAAAPGLPPVSERPRRRRRIRPGRTAVGVLMVLGACLSLQLGASLAIGLFPTFGPWGTTVLRVGVAALVLLALVRPPLRAWTRAQWGAVLLLGAAFAGMNGFFYAAIDRIPLGVAVTIEFLGPLAVAAALSRRLRDVLWVVLAFAGIVLFLVQNLVARPAGAAEPLDMTGVWLVLVAAVSWGLYILAGQRVGRLVPGTGGLAVAMGVATLMVMPLGLPELARASAVTPGHVLGAIGTGLFASLLPYLLEFHALKRLRSAVFGVLVSVEPAIATAVGFLVLGQAVGLWAVLAMVLVISASVGTTLSREAGTSRPGKPRRGEADDARPADAEPSPPEPRRAQATGQAD